MDEENHSRDAYPELPTDDSKSSSLKMCGVILGSLVAVADSHDRRGRNTDTALPASQYSGDSHDRRGSTDTAMSVSQYSMQANQINETSAGILI